MERYTLFKDDEMLYSMTGGLPQEWIARRKQQLPTSFVRGGNENDKKILKKTVSKTGMKMLKWSGAYSDGYFITVNITCGKTTWVATISKKKVGVK